MLRISKLKADSNKILNQILRTHNIQSKLPLNFLKKDFCLKEPLKISEKLSFLNTEEEMRKYFNIVDFDKKDADEIFSEDLKKHKQAFLDSQKEFDNFDRKKLLEFINKYKSELKNLDKEENIQNNLFEILNEYSLPREKLNFVQNKPNNYLLVTNISNFKTEDEIIHFMEKYGTIESYNFIKDLNGDNAGLEIFYDKDESARLAIKYLNNQNYKNQCFLKIKSNKDCEKEEIDNKTLIIKNLNPSLSQEAVFNELCSYGHIIKFEMPLINKVNSANKIGRIIDLGENYLNILINSVEETTNKENMKNQINEKAKFNFYFNYMNKLIFEFKNVLASYSDKISPESHHNILNNLLVEINFFLRKFFPEVIVNSLIKQEFEETEKISKKDPINFVKDSLKLRKLAFEKIIDNLEKLVSRYNQKLTSLSKPLTKEEILIDLQDFEVGGKDPEKITEDLIKKADGEEQIKVVKNLEDMKLYSSFYPLEQKIAKYNFFKSLTEEEKKTLSDQYNISLSINKPDFLDYFIKFNRAMGIEIFDKYIELSKLYIAMSPVEKLNHARNIIDNKYYSKNIPQFKSGVLDFLELKNIQTQLFHKFDYSIFKRMQKSYADLMYSIILDTYKGSPNLTYYQMSKLLNKSHLIHSKNRYLSFIGNLNLKRNIYYAKKIRKMIVIYNNDVKELQKNFALVTDPSLKSKYDHIVHSMEKTLFPNVFKPQNLRGFRTDRRSDIGIESEIREATLEDFKDLDNEPAIIKSAARDLKDHFKYTGKAMNENQILNRLEHLRTSITHITEFFMNVTDKQYYKKLKMERVDKKIKQKLLEDAEVLFADDPHLKAHYVKKINSELSKFSYVNDRSLKDTPFTFQEICKDLIYREYNYMQRVRVGMNFLSSIQENLGIKVNKNNFVEAVSINGVLTHLNYDYAQNFSKKNYTRNHFYGSPVISYIKNIRNFFEQELQKVENIKELKMREINIPTLDEAQSTRVDLIENYTTKIAEYEKLKKERIENEVKRDLDNYKFEFIMNGENFENLNLNNNVNTFNNNLNNFFLSNTTKSLLNLEKELIKKEFEIMQNISSFPENIEEYKDVSSLVKNISNLQKENSNLGLSCDNDKENEYSFKKVDKILKQKKLQNKGYAFVTFLTSDEAKKVYFEGQLGLKIKNKLCEIEPKFNKTHNNMDIQRLLDLSKNDAIIIGKEEEIKQAEQKIFNYENELEKNLDLKQKELKEVIAAYRDLYSDPFKKHDSNNPFSIEEEERLKFSLKKLEENTGISNYWILEEDKLDELRKIKDKRITKKYLDWQLLKKGVIPENVLKSLKETTENQQSTASVLAKEIKTNFSDKEKMELAFNILKNNSNNYESGRMNNIKISDKKAFIEAYLGKDYLESDTFGFQKEKRDDVIYQEIKELRERFPKELFEKKIYGEFSKSELEKKLKEKNPDSDSLALNLENLIENINEKYLNILKIVDEEKQDEVQLTKIELLDRITNLSPVNKKIQLIITERNRLLENEELKQSISIKNFIDNIAIREFDNSAKLVDKNSINKQYLVLQDIKYESSLSKNYWNKDSRVFHEWKEDEKPKISQEPIVEPPEGDSSFAAFIARRKIQLEKNKKENASQFDSSNINLEQIKEIQEEKNEKILDNIRLKYRMHMSSTLANKNNDEFLKRDEKILNLNENKKSLDIEENIFDFLKNKQSLKKDKLDKFQEKIKIEKKKAEFISELEKNFSKEIETLPTFREYFESLKNEVDPLKEKIQNEKFTVDNLKELISYKTDSSTKDYFRDQIALLSKGKLSSEEYENYFSKQIKKDNCRLDEWINEEAKNTLIDEIKFNMGINKENETQMLKIFESKYALIFDPELDHLKNYRELMEKIEYIGNTEEFFENEYFFSAKPLELLGELARISKLRNLNVTVKFDQEGKLIIRREFKNAYKYDLDFIVNFDINTERQKLIENIKNNNFLKDLEKETRAVTKFLNYVLQNNITLSDKRLNFIEYVEKLIEAFDFKIQNYFNNPLFSFQDCRDAIFNLESLPIIKVKPFLNAVIGILNIPNTNKENIFDLSESLEKIAEFSNGIFMEREIVILGNLILFSNRNLEKGINIPLIEKDIDNESRRKFINEVLVKSLEQISEFDFNKKDLSIILCLLRNDKSFNDNLKIYNVVKAHLWNNYKKEMNEKYSLLFKKEKEINQAFLGEICGNIRDLFEIIKQNSAKNFEDVNLNINNIQEEINEFSTKMQEYYIDVANMINSNDYIENIVNDDELFFEEITEQIEKKLLRQKSRKLNRNNLIKKRYNEVTLLRKQMSDIDKYEKYLEGLTLNDYFTENKEMLTELRRIINECKKRREALLSQELLMENIHIQNEGSSTIKNKKHSISKINSESKLNSKNISKRSYSNKPILNHIEINKQKIQNIIKESSNNNKNSNININNSKTNFNILSNISNKNEEKLCIEFGDSNPKTQNNKNFPNNKIISTKYNLITWAPKSLFIQFRRAANIYFLIVTILTSMYFSPKQPGSMIATFCFVLSATMLKEGIEDYYRYIQDRQSNNRSVSKLIKRQWVEVPCWTLRPGDVVRIKKEEEFSADVLIIKSTNDTGYCYIDTKNLDGETNLKEKCSLEDFKKIEEDDIEKLNFHIEVEMPNENLTSWKGMIVYEDKEGPFCSLANLILKGSVLKNTKYILGIIIYSGKNTKIMKNSKVPRMKMSKVLVTMNKLLYSVFAFQVVLCLTFAILSTNWVNNNYHIYKYIFASDKPDFKKNLDIVNIVLNFLTFFVAYSHMIPISLYVALEIVKIIQGLLIKFDNKIFDFGIDKPAMCRSTDLIEELGQVEFIFSDKTGTLTQNSMILKKVYINGKVYGSMQDEHPETQHSINGDMSIYKKLKVENQKENNLNDDDFKNKNLFQNSNNKNFYFNKNCKNNNISDIMSENLNNITSVPKLNNDNYNEIKLNKTDKKDFKYTNYNSYNTINFNNINNLLAKTGNNEKKKKLNNAIKNVKNDTNEITNDVENFTNAVNKNLNNTNDKYYKDILNPISKSNLNLLTQIPANQTTFTDIENDKKMILDFFYLLTLCHACFPEKNKEGKIIYQGASPDDIALVKGAQQMGFEYAEKEFSEMTIKNHILNSEKKYDLKVEFPFDSDRKRMSVIVQEKGTNNFSLLSKGADTMMLSRMILDPVELEEINRVIKVLSKEGLRVLVIGSKQLAHKEFNSWYKNYTDDRNNGKDLNKLYEKIECNLNFMGLTAIEDKLQDGVPDTIYTLLTCNIRIWVLTGDKQDTAEEIAKSCKLINENMSIIYLINDPNGKSPKEKLIELIEKYGLKPEIIQYEKTAGFGMKKKSIVSSENFDKNKVGNFNNFNKDGENFTRNLNNDNDNFYFYNKNNGIDRENNNLIDRDHALNPKTAKSGSSLSKINKSNRNNFHNFNKNNKNTHLKNLNSQIDEENSKYSQSSFFLNNEDDFTEEIIDLEYITKKIRKKEGKDISLIIDGITLEEILQDKKLSYLFFKISIAAKSVVCCRVSPKQKSKVVQLVKKYGKWVTLSIGDGANDVPMIMEANIGVGIQGKEGTQAVRSADFSIGQFRFLERLLLIYGRVGYMKISKFICYYFYKNIILVFTDIFFAFSNGFSGQIYYADYLSTLYNALFTSWPCVLTFAFEKDLKLSLIKKFPILYVAGQKNYFFNLKIFWGYILYAIFHGFICFYIPNLGLLNANDKTGITFNHWYKSTTSFSLVIEIVTLKLMVISNFWNSLNIFSTFVSIILYYLILIALCFKPISVIIQNELAGLIFNLFTYSKFWLIILIGPLLALLPDITIKQIFYSIYPTPTEYIKQYINDQVFKNMVFNDENQTSMLTSDEAKIAEKRLQEILKRARALKLKKKLVGSSMENSDPLPGSSLKILNSNDLNQKNIFENSHMKIKKKKTKYSKFNNNLPYKNNSNKISNSTEIIIENSDDLNYFENNDKREHKIKTKKIINNIRKKSQLDYLNKFNKINEIEIHKSGEISYSNSFSEENDINSELNEYEQIEEEEQNEEFEDYLNSDNSDNYNSSNLESEDKISKNSVDIGIIDNGLKRSETINNLHSYNKDSIENFNSNSNKNKMKHNRKITNKNFHSSHHSSNELKDNYISSDQGSKIYQNETNLNKYNKKKEIMINEESKKEEKLKQIIRSKTTQILEKIKNNFERKNSTKFKNKQTKDDNSFNSSDSSNSSENSDNFDLDQIKIEKSSNKNYESYEKNSNSVENTSKFEQKKDNSLFNEEIKNEIFEIREIKLDKRDSNISNRSPSSLQQNSFIRVSEQDNNENNFENLLLIRNDNIRVGTNNSKKNNVYNNKINDHANFLNEDAKIKKIKKE